MTSKTFTRKAVLAMRLTFIVFCIAVVMHFAAINISTAAQHSNTVNGITTATTSVTTSTSVSTTTSVPTTTSIPANVVIVQKNRRIAPYSTKIMYSIVHNSPSISALLQTANVPTKNNYKYIEHISEQITNTTTNKTTIVDMSTAIGGNFNNITLNTANTLNSSILNPIIVNYSNSGFTGVYMKPKVNVSGISMNIDSYTSVPSSQPAFNSNFYKYIVINDSVSDKLVNKTEYVFSVNKSWIAAQNIGPGQVMLYKYVSGIWQQLPTYMIAANATSYTYKAYSDSFSTYVVSFAANSVSDVSGATLSASVTLPSGYPLYLCTGGASVAFHTPKPSWTVDSEAPSGFALKYINASVGHQTSNVCTATEQNTSYYGLTVGGIGLDAEYYNVYTTNAYNTGSTTLPYTVATSNSFVAIIGSDGFGGGLSVGTLPPGCTTDVDTVGNYSDVFIATCTAQDAGSYSVSISGTSPDSFAFAAYVFPPQSIALNDNPSSATITTNGATYANGSVISVLGTNSIHANSPTNLNLLFQNWSSSSPSNVIIANVIANPTTLTVLGSGALTANFNGITTFTETGLPSATTWNTVYDGILNASSTNAITFDTLPNNYSFTVADQVVNSITYIPAPSSGNALAGSTVQVIFSPEGQLTLTMASNTIAYNASDLISATAPSSSNTVEILIGKGLAPGVEVASSTGSVTCNVQSTCNASSLPLAVGTYNVTAYVPSSGKYSPSQTLTVNKAVPALSLSVPPSYTYDGNGGTVNFAISSAINQLTANLYVNGNGVTSTTTSNTYTTAPNVGSYTVKLSTAGNSNYTNATITKTFSILPVLYTVAYSTASSFSTIDNLSVSAPGGYPIYLCDGGANNIVKYTSGTFDMYSSTNYSYIGHQATNTCKETTANPDLAEGIIGVKAFPDYTLYDQNFTTSGTLTYTVSQSDSFVAILIAAGFYGLSGSPTIPAGCTVQKDTTGPDTYESAYIAVCESQNAGSYSVSAALANTGGLIISAYVFPPGALTMDDNPTTGTISTNNNTYSNGQTANVLGKGTITANPPNSNFVFTDWSVSNSNLTVQNPYAQTTNLTVIGNGIITAGYNGITTFTENGLPSGRLWEVAYDGITNSSTGNVVKFNTLPGSHQFTVANVLINGYNYTPVPDAGNVVAGNTTAIVFQPPVCTISLNANSISFGSLTPGTTHPDNLRISDTDTGTAIAYLYTSGTGWAGATQSFGVSNTSWSTSSLTVLGAERLSGTLSNTSISIAPGTSNSIYFGLNVPGAIPAGTYTQTITITNSC